MTKDFNYQQYSQHFQQYLESNLDGTIGGGTPKARIELIKRYLPIGRTVFEIGSAGGEDAELLKDAGYEVIASDYVAEFVKILQEKGLRTIQFDAKHDELPQKIDCIYANAVFVHFSPKEVSEFLERAKNKLIDEKLIFLSVIKGQGYERNARSRGFERDFYYYSSYPLKEMIEKIGYEILYFNDNDEKWIHVIMEAK